MLFIQLNYLRKFLTFYVCFTPKLVLKNIKKLKANSSGGPAGLPASVIKVTSDSMALAIIFNSSLHSGIIQDIWKHASVVPVFKKGSPCDPCNNRPFHLRALLASYVSWYKRCTSSLSQGA